MGEQDAFERILASLCDAMLDDTRWSVVSALIDEACGLTSNYLMVGEGPKDDVRVLFLGAYCRGQRREDLEREYLDDYHPTDERVPRVRQLPDGRLVHVNDLYTVEELKTSRTYNELLHRTGQQDSLNVRLDGPDGSHISCAFGDPVDSDGWGSSRITVVTALLPHIRQFVRVRQALVRAEARNTTVTALLDNPRIGVLHLDRRGRIMESRTTPAASCGTAMDCRTETGCCAPAGQPTRSVSIDWWATRCRPPARPRSVGRCCSAVRPCRRRSWCTSSRWVSVNPITERGTLPRWC